MLYRQEMIAAQLHLMVFVEDQVRELLYTLNFHHCKKKNTHQPFHCFITYSNLHAATHLLFITLFTCNR